MEKPRWNFLVPAGPRKQLLQQRILRCSLRFNPSIQGAGSVDPVSAKANGRDTASTSESGERLRMQVEQLGCLLSAQQGFEGGDCGWDFIGWLSLGHTMLLFR